MLEAQTHDRTSIRRSDEDRQRNEDNCMLSACTRTIQCPLGKCTGEIACTVSTAAVTAAPKSSGARCSDATEVKVRASKERHDWTTHRSPPVPKPECSTKHSTIEGCSKTWRQVEHIGIVRWSSGDVTGEKDLQQLVCQRAPHHQTFSMYSVRPFFRVVPALNLVHRRCFGPRHCLCLCACKRQ